MMASGMPDGSGQQPSLQGLLELAGEPSAQDVRQLALRGQGVRSFAPYASQLQSLECLSLSHNQLRSLDGFSHLHSLVTLNVNNNQLSSLEGLQGCLQLRELYVANNRLRDLQPLAPLTKLGTLNCLKNSIASLDGCLQVLRILPALTDLDLSGNPAAAVPDAKHLLVLALPSLQLLEGERVTDVDRQMALEVLGPLPADAPWAEDNQRQASSQPLAGQLPSDTFTHAAGGAQVLTLYSQPSDPAATFEPTAASQLACGPLPATQSSSAAGPGQDMAAPAPCVSQPQLSLPGSSAFELGRQHSLPAAQDGAPAGLGSLQQAGSALERPLCGIGTGHTPAGPRPSAAAGQPLSSRLSGGLCKDARPHTALPARPGTAGGYTHQLISDAGLNDHPLLLEYLAKHVLAEGSAAVGMQGCGSTWGSKARGSFAARLRTTASVMSSAQAAQQPVQQLVAAGVVQSALPPAGGSAAAAAALLDGATPHELIRQLVRLAEVLIQKLGAANKQLASHQAAPASLASAHCADGHIAAVRPGSARAGTSATGAAGSAGRPGSSCSSVSARSACEQPQPHSRSQAGALQPASAALECSTAAPAVKQHQVGSDGLGNTHALQQWPAELQGEACSSSQQQPQQQLQAYVTNSQGGEEAITGAAAVDAAAASPSNAAQPGAATMPASVKSEHEGDGGQEVPQLQRELAQLRRQVKQLQVENQNMYWLADEYKRLKAELSAQHAVARG